MATLKAIIFKYTVYTVVAKSLATLENLLVKSKKLIKLA